MTSACSSKCCPRGRTTSPGTMLLCFIRPPKSLIGTRAKVCECHYCEEEIFDRGVRPVLKNFRYWFKFLVSYEKSTRSDLDRANFS